jgi:hypothetical protein
VTGAKVLTDDPKIEATIHNLVLRAIWCLEFIHPCCTISIEVLKTTYCMKDESPSNFAKGVDFG